MIDWQEGLLGLAHLLKSSKLSPSLKHWYQLQNLKSRLAIIVFYTGIQSTPNFLVQNNSNSENWPWSVFPPVKGMGLSLHTSRVAYQTLRDFNRGFCSIRRLGVIPLLPGRVAYPSEYPSSMFPVPIYTARWRETKWGQGLCQRWERDGKAWTRVSMFPNVCISFNSYI